MVDILKTPMYLGGAGLKVDRLYFEGKIEALFPKHCKCLLNHYIYICCRCRESSPHHTIHFIIDRCAFRRARSSAFALRMFLVLFICMCRQHCTTLCKRSVHTRVGALLPAYVRAFRSMRDTGDFIIWCTRRFSGAQHRKKVI